MKRFSRAAAPGVRCDPILYGLGDELRPIVGPDVARHAAWDEEGLSDAGMRSNVMLKFYLWAEGNL